MTRFTGEMIESKVQVLDANGDPATGATVNWKLYDAGDVLFDSGVMLHIADGIFTVGWTPDAVGEWTFEAYSSNPKFRSSKTYIVQDPVLDSVVYITQADTAVIQAPPVQNQWYTLCDLSAGAEVYEVTIAQWNTEVDTKDLAIEITENDNAPYFQTGSYIDSLPVFAYHAYGKKQAQLRQQDAGGDLHLLYGPGAVESDGVTVNYSHPYPCARVKIRFRITSALGTNQNLQGTIAYAIPGKLKDYLED